MDPDLSLEKIVVRALAEDIGPGDVTARATVPEGARARARVVQKEPGVVYGFAPAEEALRACGAEGAERLVVEGRWRESVPAEILVATGPAAALLAAERTALNFLCHLSGIATLTARYVERVEGTGARILDTRKTTPGLRTLEKAAVSAGGGRNHRMGLHDAILIKENHAAMAGGITGALAAARAAQPDLSPEVECRDIEEVREALEAGAERLLLDNMDLGLLRRCVALRNEASARALLEASGGVDLETVREIAETGVDLISVGALTHSAPALDLSMLIEPL